MSDLNLEGMAVAEDVVETIISQAVKDVDGVAGLAATGGPAGILQAFQQKKESVAGIEASANDDGSVSVTVRIAVKQGFVIPDVADAVRSAIADAMLTQVGVQTASVDVYVDGVQAS